MMQWKQEEQRHWNLHETEELMLMRNAIAQS